MDLKILPIPIINIIYEYVIFIPKTNEELAMLVNHWYIDKLSIYSKYGHISSWDTKLITDMSNLFFNKTYFNDIISSWNVDNVKNMSCMFLNAELFNQPLNSWNVSNVTNMNCMFYNAKSFNQNLDNWIISNNIINMHNMFDKTYNLNILPKWYTYNYEFIDIFGLGI